MKCSTAILVCLSPLFYNTARHIRTFGTSVIVSPLTIDGSALATSTGPHGGPLPDVSTTNAAGPVHDEVRTSRLWRPQKGRDLSL